MQPHADSTEFVLGIDAGGTFTDFFLVSLQQPPSFRVHKILSTPQAPEQAIIQGIRELELEPLLGSGRLHIIHGSTVATNAALEGKFARTVYITNKGFADTLTLARQTRPALYSLEFDPLPVPVPPELCLELNCRVDRHGAELSPLQPAELKDLIARVREIAPASVAINFLFSFVNDSHEVTVAQALQEALPELTISHSSAVLPVYKEYERGVATWLNAALSPVVQRYLDRLTEALGGQSLHIMQSSADTIPSAEASQHAVQLLLSGPAGGLTALRFLAVLIRSDRLLSFDMGGTSTDVSLFAGDIETTQEGRIGPFPVAVPMVDMHTIGAGGGSIAVVDAGGMLRVGPESAGASPGPACYGQGGKMATVTDANVVLGRIPEHTLLASRLPLRKDLAEAAVSVLAEELDLSIEETAAGIVRLANEHMVKALRLISVNRGYDVGQFRLTCFGGAGGLHVCELAESMRMDSALVPVHGGILSAVGMAVAQPGRRFTKTVVGVNFDGEDDTAESAIEARFTELEQEAREDLAAGDADLVTMQRQLELRYCGQSFTLAVPWRNCKQAREDFSEQHRVRYGYSLHDEIELVNLQLQASLPARPIELPTLSSKSNSNSAGNKPRLSKVYGEEESVPCWQRDALVPGMSISGPAIVQESVATTYIAREWQAQVDEFGNLLLNRG